MVEMAEIKLEPIDFGLTDDDRMKDLWVDVYKNVYGYMWTERKASMDRIAGTSAVAVNDACKYFKQWLDVREVVVNDPVGDPKP